MKEITGDIWNYHTGHPSWLIIPTNGNIRNDNLAVMGAGLAKQCAERYPNIQKLLGIYLKRLGNNVYIFLQHSIFTLPTKHNWKEKSDLKLIELGLAQLAGYLAHEHLWNIHFRYVYQPIERIYLPRLGCGLGGLSWDNEVKPILSNLLDDRFIVVHREN